jgi:hypothetical protein
MPKSLQSKRDIKRYRRRDEPKLKEALQIYFQQCEYKDDLSDKEREQLLLPIRWSLFSLLYYHLKLARGWSDRKWFLEIPDIKEIEKIDHSIIIKAEVIWWPEGTNVNDKWWPSDRQPIIDHHNNNNKWMIEPVIAIIAPFWGSNRRLRYKLEFGVGSTYKVFANHK